MDGTLYKVIYDGSTGQVTINGVVQEGITYEYNPSLAQQNANTSTNSTGISLYAVAPKSGYSYVGTLKGHTKEAKNATAFATTLSTLIPGGGRGVKAVKALLSFTKYNAEDKIPSKYYSYDLYQKGFMTDKWYQYSTLRLYEDKNYKTASEEPWTSSPQKIDLPNS